MVQSAKRNPLGLLEQVKHQQPELPCTGYMIHDTPRMTNPDSTIIVIGTSTEGSAVMDPSPCLTAFFSHMISTAYQPNRSGKLHFNLSVYQPNEHINLTEPQQLHPSIIFFIVT
mmetsp:Transcript_28704/g.34872  ORF Transcript_28704/g.34872 Transcript_28704/m.34872 type:complete len:114 (-) Transcript_28704:206-547(-)